MNRCLYCGKKYPDDVTACPVDGESVVKREEPRSSDPQSAFSITLVSPISAAGTYRVFVERSDLIFIQLEGGTKSVLGALAHRLGPLGGLVPLVLWLFSRKKAKQRDRVHFSVPLPELVGAMG